MAAHKAKKPLIKRKTQEGNCEDRGTAGERKAPCMNCSAEADISAHQVKRAVRQIDDTQQTEDQGEPARHNEQQGAKGRSVKKLKSAHGP